MEKSIILNGNIINYKLLLKNKKNVSISINLDAEIIVRAPISVSTEYIDKLLTKNQKWILKKITEIKNKLNENSNKTPYLGENLSIIVEKCHYEKVYIHNESIIIKTSNLNPNYIKLLLYNWYRNQAEVVLKIRAKELADLCNLFPSKIIIKNQKSIWGSCNSKKEVRLNWRLILMPIHAMDYVIIHELCHIKHMNHSIDFWSLVGSYISDYKTAKKWIKENGINVMKIN